MGTKILHVDYNEEIAVDIGDKLSLGKKLSDFLSLDSMQSQNLKSLFEKDQVAQVGDVIAIISTEGDSGSVASDPTKEVSNPVASATESSIVSGNS